MSLRCYLSEVVKSAFVRDKLLLVELFQKVGRKELEFLVNSGHCIYESLAALEASMPTKTLAERNVQEVEYATSARLSYSLPSLGSSQTSQRLSFCSFILVFLKLKNIRAAQAQRGSGVDCCPGRFRVTELMLSGVCR